MSLRLRLSLVFGVFGLVAVVAVSAVGFVATERRLRGQVDDVLTAYAARLADPDGQLALAVCNRFVRPDLSDVGDRSGKGRGGPSDDLAGAIVRCVNIPDVASATFVRAPAVSEVSTVDVSGTAYRTVTVLPSIGGSIQIARDANEAEQVLGAIRVGTVVLGSIVTALAALAGWFTAHRLARPLERLTVAAEEVSTTGRLDVELPDGGDNETGRLARAFRQMLRSLDDSRDRQQRLAQDAGHELRTPLTSLRTNIATLRRHPTMPDATKEQVLADLELEVAEMSTMVEGLVALVAHDAEDEPVGEVDLEELVVRSVERLGRRVNREVRLVTSPVRLHGRATQLSTAVDNLLDNAAKFSPPDQPIEVWLDRERLVVRDHGPGIPPVDIPHVFDRFHRSDAARTMPGSGLGLAIVRDAAQAHGATVSAANAPDGGAVLTIHWAQPAR